MIKEACSLDKAEVYQLYQSTYPNVKKEFLDFYFANYYQDSTKVVFEVDNHISACAQMNEHVTRIDNHVLACSFISGVCTAFDYRRRGQMRAIMHSLLDQASHGVLLTYIQAMNPKLFEVFGFETLFVQKQYNIHTDMLKDISSKYVTFDASSMELAGVYAKFMQRFDGYFVRDAKYFEMLKKGMKALDKQLYVYKKGEKIMGYVVCAKKGHEYFVEEAIYLEPIVLVRLLKAALGGKSSLILCVSEHERIEKLFPLAIGRKHMSVMVRVNQFELFSKLFAVKCSSTKEAMALCKKPLWCNEYY